MKVAQLYWSEYPNDDYSIICVDEAQDMTECQASIFWGSQRNRRVFIFGDQWQQLYRFRGASTAFEQSTAKADRDLSLTGSFRFGENIASVANFILRQVSDSPVRGLNMNSGTIRFYENEDEIQRGVVICRKNISIITFLLDHLPTKWSLLSTKSKNLIPKNLEHLESFVLGEADRFRYDGETFASLGELEEYLEDTDDNKMKRNIATIEALKERNLRSNEARDRLKTNYEDLAGRSINSFDGVVLTTCHGAKGLEFDTVYLHNDFQLEKLHECKEFANTSFLLDELRMLYVAATRAKITLFLPKDSGGFFDPLLSWSWSSAAEKPSARKSEEISEEISPENLAPLRNKFEKDWEEFANSPDPDKIPWLKEGPNTCLLDQQMSEDEQKEWIRSLLLCFHPDKCFSMLRKAGTKMTPNAKEALKERLNKTMKEIYTIRKYLNNSALDEA